MKIHTRYLYFLIIFFIPFSGFVSIPGSGELGMEMYMIPLLVFIFFYFYRYNWKVTKSIDTMLLVMFFLTVVLSIFLNYYHISHYYFKHKSGFDKAISQLIMLVLFLVFYLFFCDYVKRIGLQNIIEITYKYNLYAFTVVVTWGALEVLDWYTGFHLNAFLNEHFRAERYIPGIMYRLRSTSYEPPALAMYLIFSLNLFFYKVLSTRSKFVFICILLHFILILLSDSRTGLIVSLVQVALLLWFLLGANSVRLKMLMLMSSPIIFLVLIQLINIDFIHDKIASVYNWNESGGYHTASNVARFASQYAALSIFSDNVLFGAGIGQFGFLASNHYPVWANSNYLISMWSLTDNDVWPPGFSFYTRLLSEVGLLGFLIFILLVSIPIVKIRYKTSRFTPNVNAAFLSKVGLISSILVLMQFDSIRYIGFWIYLSLSYSLLKANKSARKYENSKNELV